LNEEIAMTKEIQSNSNHVEIFRPGNEAALGKIPANALHIFEILTSVPEDFMADGREDNPPQERR
jgi:antitoxin VapB